MLLMGNLVEDGVALVLGAGTVYLLYLWRDRASRKTREAEAAKARLEAEQIVQHARIAAQDEALKLRQEVEH